ncbi:hypothetical protein C8F01DRAFT_1080754 [Mycena amicta]|nr:hypothetical protein C8F01DRAFT_1080754 [Mycena amicta]
MSKEEAETANVFFARDITDTGFIAEFYRSDYRVRAIIAPHIYSPHTGQVLSSSYIMDCEDARSLLCEKLYSWAVDPEGNIVPTWKLCTWTRSNLMVPSTPRVSTPSKKASSSKPNLGLARHSRSQSPAPIITQQLTPEFTALALQFRGREQELLAFSLSLAPSTEPRTPSSLSFDRPLYQLPTPPPSHSPLINIPPLLAENPQSTPQKLCPIRPHPLPALYPPLPPFHTTARPPPTPTATLVVVKQRPAKKATVVEQEQEQEQEKEKEEQQEEQQEEEEEEEEEAVAAEAAHATYSTPKATTTTTTTTPSSTSPSRTRAPAFEERKRQLQIAFEQLFDVVRGRCSPCAIRGIPGWDQHTPSKCTQGVANDQTDPAWHIWHSTALDLPPAWCYYCLCPMPKVGGWHAAGNYQACANKNILKPALYALLTHPQPSPHAAASGLVPTHRFTDPTPNLYALRQWAAMPVEAQPPLRNFHVFLLWAFEERGIIKLDDSLRPLVDELAARTAAEIAAHTQN